jgi:hypothetical protein
MTPQQIISRALKEIQDFNLDDDYDAYTALDRVHKILLTEYPESGLVRLATPPAPLRDGTTVGVQPTARIIPIRGDDP